MKPLHIEGRYNDSLKLSRALDAPAIALRFKRDKAP